MRSPSPTRQSCQARAHSRGSAFAGPETTPIGRPPRMRRRCQCSESTPSQPVRGRKMLEDQHRVADVDPELTAVPEARRRLRVVAEHAARARP